MIAELAGQRLSQISTAWSLIDRTRGGPGAGSADAVGRLVERYRSAVYRYLVAATRDPDAADDLSQDFALRLVRGDFGKTDPARGRFRDYVKAALINLVATHHAKQKRRAHAPLTADPAAPEAGPFDSDAEFLLDWRQALLDLAWRALAADQSPSGPPFHTVLRLRFDNPSWTAGQLAGHLNASAAEPTFTEAGVRKVLQRAREKFTDFLVAEVARSLGAPTDEALRQELFDLGFHLHCAGAMERWAGEASTRRHRSPG